MTTSPGLDMHTLRQIAADQRSPAHHAHLLDRIAAHLDAHDGFVSWSGGKDSTVVVDLARQVDPNIPVVFFDSGLQFPETLHYLEEQADILRLNFQVIPAEPDLLTLLIAGGGFDHHAPDRTLQGPLAEVMITGPARQAHARHGPGSLWGVRAQESPGRRHLYRRSLAAASRAQTDLDPHQLRAQAGGVIHRADNTITYGPIWDWQTARVFEYLAGRRIPPNPLYAKLTQLGAPQQRIRVDSIIDAALLSNGHITWLQKGWPLLFDQLVTALPRLTEWT
ncbi:phosphoadenosine phosphosulfate reductase family protein [Mycolicibacterium sp.]|uniref:phosphoadenosine phosphosulfate reductase domain-containing protein n=1 Tax=Mycolicibacterium sp. TaxID=2320850 RepID=UPI00355DEFEE